MAMRLVAHFSTIACEQADVRKRERGESVYSGIIHTAYPPHNLPPDRNRRHAASSSLPSLGRCAIADGITKLNTVQYTYSIIALIALWESFDAS